MEPHQYSTVEGYSADDHHEAVIRTKNGTYWKSVGHDEEASLVVEGVPTHWYWINDPTCCYADGPMLNRWISDFDKQKYRAGADFWESLLAGPNSPHPLYEPLARELIKLNPQAFMYYKHRKHRAHADGALGQNLHKGGGPGHSVFSWVASSSHKNHRAQIVAHERRSSDDADLRVDVGDL